MSEQTTPPSPKKIDFIDTPPTSPCGHEAVISGVYPLVVGISNPKKFKRKVALIFASLYDEEPTSKYKAEPKEIVELASSLWKEAALELIPGNEQKVAENKEAFGNSRVGLLEVIDEHRKKDLPQLLEPSATESPEKAAEVMLMATTEPGLTEAMTSPSTNPDTGLTVVVDPTEAIHSTNYTSVTEVSQMEHAPNTINVEAEKIKIRHEWTGTCQFDLITEKSIELQKEASFTQNVKCGN